MGTNNLVFLELLEWFDETGQELVHRLPGKILHLPAGISPVHVFPIFHCNGTSRGP